MGATPDFNNIDPGTITPEELAELMDQVLKGVRGHVNALDALSGEEIWNYQTGGAVYSSAAVVDGVMYIGSMDSNVYAFGTSDQIEFGDLTTYLIIGIIIIVVVVLGLALFRKKK